MSDTDWLAGRVAGLIPRRPAVVALTGGGGKTTLLYALGRFLQRQGWRVLLSTTTRVYPPGADEASLWTGLEPPPFPPGRMPYLWGAGIDAAGKVAGIEPALFPSLSGNYDYLLVEADGSRGLPLKFWRPGEPVLPRGVTDVICLASTRAVGRPVAEALHRYDAAAELIALPRRVDMALWAALRLYQRQYLRRLIPGHTRLLMVNRGPRRLMEKMARYCPGWWWSENDLVFSPPASPVAAAVLAAGAARRFGGGKLLASCGGRPLLGRVLALINSTPLYPRLVVTGCEKGVAEIAEKYGFEAVEHPGWAAGMGSSLARGIDALFKIDAGAGEVPGVLIFLGDMPLLRRRTVLFLLAAVRRENPRVAYPVYNGRRGHPVYFSRECFPALLSLRGERGGREVMDGFDRHLAVPVDDRGVIEDIDTAEDLALIKQLLLN